MFTNNKIDRGFDLVLSRFAIKAFLLILVFAAAGFYLGLQKAEAADFVSCYDVAGEGMEVPFGGVPNSGKPIFDDVVAGAPAFGYQACLEDEGVYPYAANVSFGAPGIPYYQVKGWLWDDNLGWISMYCSGTTNLGRPCGPVNYGVTIDDAGYLHGYAWGDNTGWISFDNGGFSNVRIDISQPECQGYVYGPTKPYAVCPNHTKVDTMAWSDNVGWIDFDGVIFPWYQVVEALTNANVVVELLPDPATLDKYGASKPPFADGSDAYTLRVTILDDDGDPVESPRYTTEISFAWQKDTVKYIQTDPSIILDLAALPTCGFLAPRATTKPCSFTEAANYTAGTGIWEGDITSLAPTSDMNASQDGFSYETFVLPTTLTGGSLESNDMMIGNANIRVFDNDVGLCAYCDDLALNTPVPRGFNTPEKTNIALSFMPQTELTTLTDPDGNDYIDISVGNPETFRVEGRRAAGATVELHVGMDAVAGLKFVFDDSGDGQITWDDDSAIVKSDVAGLLGGALTSFIAGIAQEPEVEVEQIVKGLYMYSVVTEPGGVKYYSNKLPRVTGSTAVQPVAILRGSVYSTGAVTTTKTSGVIRSLGEISTNLVRDQVFRNVSSLIAGATLPGGEVTLGENGSGGFKKIAGAGSVVSLLNDLSTVPQVYYARGDVHIGNVNWTGERTIVTIGGNIYIDGDLYNPGVTPRPKLGLIALKDFTASGAVQDTQGHVYILNTVSNIQANIYADGSIFSYETGLGEKLDGRPDYADESAYELSTKYNQLYIEGSVASQNTVGGASRSPMINGSGKTTTDLLEARQYDLNYLRMYTGLINRDAAGNALDSGGNIVADADLKIIDVDGKPWSVYKPSDAGDLYPPDEIDGSYVPAPGLDEDLDLGSTYIFFDPPSASLPGFTAGSQFDITVRPQ